MECIYLAPYPQDGERPPAASIHWIGVDDDWTEAPELGHARPRLQPGHL